MGDVGEPVNRGVWTVEAPPGSAEALFDTLGAVDCRQIERIVPDGWPEVVAVGGGAVSYKIEGKDGNVFELRFADSVTYRNAQSITGPRPSPD